MCTHPSAIKTGRTLVVAAVNQFAAPTDIDNTDLSDQFHYYILIM